MPVLHLLAGSNGAGKTTLYERVLREQTHLPFINADVIAAERWPGEEEAHGHDASAAAAVLRDATIAEGRSFVAETVFSHESKLVLVDRAHDAGYLVVLHVVVIPEALAVARVADRVRHGGHAVPEDKVRSRYQRLWPLVAAAIARCEEAHVYDNSTIARPLRRVARFRLGRLVGTPDWPPWMPAAILGSAP